MKIRKVPIAIVSVASKQPQSEFTISRELLEEILGFIEDKILDEKREGVELERLLELEDFYERVRDETGHTWE